MDRKNLDKILDYIPVIIGTCDRYGWAGGKGCPVPESAAPETRTFFDHLLTHIPINEIPELEDVEGDLIGGIRLLWETEINPEDMTFDYFAVIIPGDETVFYEGKLESLGVETAGHIELDQELDENILQYIRYFSRMSYGQS